MTEPNDNADDVVRTGEKRAAVRFVNRKEIFMRNELVGGGG